MIYLILDGRIGNQLFMYSYARKLALANPDQRIIIDDSAVLKRGYENLLPEYPLGNDIEYVHDRKFLASGPLVGRYAVYTLYRLFRKPLGFRQRYRLEKACKPLFEKLGTYFCENGYLDFSEKIPSNVLLSGYFQSDKYFKGIDKELRASFSLEGDERIENYPNIDLIRDRNSVCVSIKVQHNVGNSIYDVCNDGYWQKAVDYVIGKVDDPLFFICSDNVDYVKEHLIDTERYEAVFQSKDCAVCESLAVMGMCKHFIIGNTTFGWWAQYLNPHEDKIVVAPSKWMSIDMPIDIYQDNWHLIEV